jgi:hypothetical protein
MTIRHDHNQTAPRPWFALFLASKGWWALAAAVALLVVTIFSVTQYRLAAALDARGVQTVATVVGGRVVRGDDSDSYYMTFAFADQAGRPYQIEKSVSGRFYRDNGRGSAQVIRYLPDRPEKMEYYVGKAQKDARLLQLVALAAGIGGLAALWYAGNQATRAIKSRRYGYAATARVTGFKEHLDDDGRKTGKGTMSWRTERGIAGTSLTHPMALLTRHAPGDTIPVFVRANESWWEGDVGPRPERPNQLPKVVPPAD